MTYQQRALLTLASCVLALSALAGCTGEPTSSDDTCGASGGVQDCLCPDTSTSVQVCQDDGTWGVCACGSSGTDDAGVADIDLDFDTDTALDAAPDTAPDTDMDAAPDTAPDTALDAAPDTALDTALDTTPDTAPDTDMDAAPDTAPDATPDAALDTMPDAALDTTPDTALAAPGEPCDGNADCASNVCLSLGDAGGACSQPCTDRCDVAGWTCFEDLCVPDDWCVDAGGVPVGPGCPTDCGDTCAAEATCSLVGGVPTCVCNAGYAGDGSTCSNVNECATDTDECDANAACADTSGSYLCTCNAGYEGDGRTCLDINECARGLDDCGSFATCTDTDGSFVCTCNDGFAGDGRSCLDVNECVLGLDDCDARATCANVAGSFTCTCGPGWEGTGTTCTDVNECTRGLDECDANATCSNSAGSYGCTCNAGFFGDGFECFSSSSCPDGTPDAGVCVGNTLSYCDAGTTVSTDCDAAWGGIGGVCGAYASGGLTCVVPTGDTCVADLGDGNVLLPCAGAAPSCEYTDGVGYVCGGGDRGSCTAADEGGCIGDMLVQACIGSTRVPYGIDCGSLGATCSEPASACTNAPEGSLCVTGLIECAAGLRCEGESAVSNGVCAPLPGGGEITCEPVTFNSVAIDYQIAADTTSYMIVPFADDPSIMTPLSIELPGGGEIDLFGANSFQLATAGIFGFINPIVVPGTPDFASQLRAGSHRLLISTDASEVCWYLLEERSAGTRIDLNIYLVGVPGVTAATAAASDLADVLDELDALLGTAGQSVGTVRWYDASASTTTAYRIIRGYDDVSELVSTSVDPGATLSDRLSLNVFLTQGFAWSDGSGVIGVSNGLPGAAALHGTRVSGVVFTTEYIDGTAFGAAFTAQVMAHEIGHYLGLFHTTEQDQVTHDPLGDTPECTSGPLDECPDVNNLMFPFAGTANTQISADQAAVIAANPLTR